MKQRAKQSATLTGGKPLHIPKHNLVLLRDHPEVKTKFRIRNSISLEQNQFFLRTQAFASPTDMASSGLWENIILTKTPTFWWCMWKIQIQNLKFRIIVSQEFLSLSPSIRTLMFTILSQSVARLQCKRSISVSYSTRNRSLADPHPMDIVPNISAPSYQPKRKLVTPQTVHPYRTC